MDTGVKTKIVTGVHGRDKGRLYLITEFPASKAEKLGIKAFIALKGSDAQIPLEYKELGPIGVAIIGLNVFLRSSVRYADLDPLLDEMMECVQYIPDRKRPESPRALMEADIMEPKTRYQLRSEIVELHTGFSFADSLSELISKMLSTADVLTTQT